MTMVNLNYVSWLLSRFARRLTIWGLSGLLLTLLGVMFNFTHIQPLSLSIADAEKVFVSANAFVNTKQDSLNVEVPIQTPKQTDTKSLEFFYKQLPNGAEVPKILALFDKTAFKRGLKLIRGDYKLSKSPLAKTSPIILRYEIVLPVSGTYLQIRQFVDEALTQQAALALSDVEIKRESSMSPLVEARLVWVLFVRGEGW